MNLDFQPEPKGKHQQLTCVHPCSEPSPILLPMGAMTVSPSRDLDPVKQKQKCKHTDPCHLNFRTHLNQNGKVSMFKQLQSYSLKDVTWPHFSKLN